MKPIRVLIVDDSATVRRLLTEILSCAPDIEVVGAAPEPAVAREMIKALNPDVLTLDIEMPHMNGLDFLEKIMRLRPMPVVMVSTLTERGAEATLDALALGAVDCFAKPTSDLSAALAHASTELVAKVRAAAQARVRPSSRAQPTTPRTMTFQKKLVAIGASTGGVEALIAVLSHFPKDCPPTVITQHMPAGFTASFANRLNRLCAPQVSEARDGDELLPNHIYLAPGGLAHLEVEGHSNLRCRLIAGDPTSGHRPSVDRLFASVAKAAGARGVGVLLTGMGRDGANGLSEMRAAGAFTIGQDETTSIVYGMPRVAAELGAVTRQLPLERIGPEIMKACAKPAVEKVA